MSTRKWSFRVASVLLGVSSFILLEAVCRTAGWGEESLSTGHFAEFADIRPLFVPNVATGEYSIARNRRRYFAEESFAINAAPNEFRIFVFGGSTVQGRPFSIPTSFTTFLEMSLQEAAPQIDWQVVNCGGISYASYRLLPAMQECLDYAPNLFIVCTGHNEFLEFISYAETRQQPMLTKGYSWLNQFNLFHLAQRFFPVPSTNKKLSNAKVLEGEVDAILDHHGGLNAYTRTALQTKTIVSSFAVNLQRMVDLSNTAGVPLMMIQPPSNLRDCPPFKSEFSDETSEKMQTDISARLKQASELLVSDSETAIRSLKTVTEDDPGFALGWYQLGRALAFAHRPNEALMALQRARDEDICPLRMTTELESVMADIVAANGLSFLNVQKLLVDESRDGIVGNATLVDHIHPSFRSHLEIGIEITRLMHEADLISFADESWVAVVRGKLEHHLQSLDDIYFLRGRQTVEVMKVWTKGRADGPPLSATAAETESVREL